mmetsp:Transcript_3946/g.10955  ORF Transcript_3946/g.10955 Transcript_3946/m.10955 type:complete len:215 (+) Transcript_3946:1171-1815(+)
MGRDARSRRARTAANNDGPKPEPCCSNNAETKLSNAADTAHITTVYFTVLWSHGEATHLLSNPPTGKPAGQAATMNVAIHACAPAAVMTPCIGSNTAMSTHRRNWNTQDIICASRVPCHLPVGLKKSLDAQITPASAQQPTMVARTDHSMTVEPKLLRRVLKMSAIVTNSRISNADPTVSNDATSISLSEGTGSLNTLSPGDWRRLAIMAFASC